MHIPDNYLSPETSAVMTAVMLPVWGIAIKKVSREVTTENISKIGIGAAFSFVGMMFNIPLPGGTTGHAVGATLIAVLLGPEAACLAVSVALLLQALIFGDGGILAFGANCFNMAFVMPYVGYYTAKLIKKLPFMNRGQSVNESDKGNGVYDVIAASIGSYVGINAAALMAAIEFGVQPYLFQDASGQALYCPYGLKVAIPAMMIGHLTLFGLAEIIYTAVVLSFIKKASPASFKLSVDKYIVKQNSENEDDKDTYDQGTGKKDRSWILLLLLIILTPLGLLAEGTAWWEWGADEIADTGIGFTPKGFIDGFSFESLIPDYSLSGMPDAVAYIMSAIIGVSLLVIIFKVVSLMVKKVRT